MSDCPPDESVRSVALQTSALFTFLPRPMLGLSEHATLQQQSGEEMSYVVLAVKSTILLDIAPESEQGNCFSAEIHVPALQGRGTLPQSWSDAQVRRLALDSCHSAWSDSTHYIPMGTL
jgi:hypothetical protein